MTWAFLGSILLAGLFLTLSAYIIRLDVDVRDDVSPLAKLCLTLATAFWLVSLATNPGWHGGL